MPSSTAARAAVPDQEACRDPYQIPYPPGPGPRRQQCSHGSRPAVHGIKMSYIRQAPPASPEVPGNERRCPEPRLFTALTGCWLDIQQREVAMTRPALAALSRCRRQSLSCSCGQSPAAYRLQGPPAFACWQVVVGDVAVLDGPDEEGAAGFALVGAVAGVVGVDVGLGEGAWPDAEGSGPGQKGCIGSSGTREPTWAASSSQWAALSPRWIAAADSEAVRVSIPSTCRPGFN